jgi:hypothetical protein
MPRLLKNALGLLLLPACLAAAAALWRVVHASGDAEAFWVMFGAGAGGAVLALLLLPKPMLTYVIGHELTHALTTWLCGGQVARFKVSSQGGHVIVSKSNWLIALAPYFLPLYAVLVVAGQVIGHWFWGWSVASPWFHFALGAAYGFHLTLTWHILGTDQTDVSGQGYLFSAAVICLGNILVLLLGLPLLTAELSVFTAIYWWWEELLLLINFAASSRGGWGA